MTTVSDPILASAIAAVDRELAANLELTTMFDQTRLAVVLENGVFLSVRPELEARLPGAAFALVAKVYDELFAAESAMERRGPARTIKDADRLLVEGWEGDAREAQRMMRAALLPLPPAAAAPARRAGGPLGWLRRLLGA